MVRKVYVEITAKFDTDGNITPLSVTWEDGTRYTCRILGQESYLFYEEPRWFVEAKR